MTDTSDHPTGTDITKPDETSDNPKDTDGKQITIESTKQQGIDPVRTKNSSGTTECTQRKLHSEDTNVELFIDRVDNRKKGSNQVRYRLNKDKDPDIFSLNSGNLADGHLHTVKINREGPSVHIEIDHFHTMNYKLSSVSDTAFNGLKSLVLGKIVDDSKPTEEEPLQNAVKSDSAVIGGVIAIVIFVILCTFAITGRLLYRNKATYQNNEPKRTDYAENADAALKNHANYQDSVSEGRKEYFI
ncbi:hypothetical protein scyTo_0008796 [Scyliorhinus torazame]|uniref:Laminin G domain-containing protein n=1 Tax=Scyliorhinus torazame TaxID=75743 RepID=A0A401PDS4_SCYTO|nr:hypothetical protein [Scyliorhinus torazame]